MKHLHVDTPVTLYKAVSFLHLMLFTCAGEEIFFFFPDTRACSKLSGQWNSRWVLHLKFG